MLARTVSRRLSQIRGLNQVGLFLTTASPSVLDGVGTGKMTMAPAHKTVRTFTSQCETVSGEPEIPIDKMVSSIYTHVNSCQPASFTEEEKKSKPLEPRTIRHSYRKFVIPLSTDNEKKKEYLSAMGNVRIGKILEDLDHMAVHVAYIHNSENGSLDGPMTLPRTIVTASVKRIDFHNEDINSSRDVIIDGQVTYAGTSSMQISIRLFQNDESGNLIHLLKADFIMVSRDPLDSNKKIRVHGLVARTPDEAETINQTKEHFKNMSDLADRQTTNEELRLIDNMYSNLISRNKVNDIPVLTPKEMWMHKTSLSVTEICFPEYQNMYGKIFGGFLMRKALELAYTNAKLYCKGRVAIRSMDHIEFAKPVEIGHVLHLNSLVTYTHGKYLQMKVVASISDQNNLSELAKANLPTLGQEAQIRTNVFNFTMESVENPNTLTVVPKHYIHASTYLEGRRLLNNTLKRIVN
uniref:HotDog ACOT-type domain-containing protein n=1 Tax=Caenorhabditis japonica TaxID=281687 RepID=A0A8R1HKV3_CAEJA